MTDPTCFCLGCNTPFGCTCPPPGYEDHLFEEAYERGYEACEADGYDNHPLHVWPTDEGEAALARDWRHLCTGGTITDTTGRKLYSSNVFHYSRRTWPWPYRYNPLHGEPDPEAYLVGWDDCGAGLPSAVRDPDEYAIHAAAMDACEPWALEQLPDIYDGPDGPWPARVEADHRTPEEDFLPF